MNRLIPTLVLAACMAASAAHATTVNLLDFQHIKSGYGDAVFAEESAALTGDARITGDVRNLVSFEWRLIDTNTGGAHTYLETTPTGMGMTSTTLASIGSPEFGLINTYTFSTPFTGHLVIGMNSGDSKFPAMFIVDKFVVSSIAAVPEPETFAMLFAGLGMMGFVSRRRFASKRQSKINQARLQMRMAG